jgi:AGZA family xanthine/uracil permease-like MFS transporter
MPVYQQTKDANFAIQIALVWCFVEALILVGGSFSGETIRKMIPRTVLLSCLSGLGLLLLAMNPMLQAFEAPTVSFIVLLLRSSLTGSVRSRFLPVFLPVCCC